MSVQYLIRYLKISITIMNPTCTLYFCMSLYAKSVCNAPIAFHSSYYIHTRILAFLIPIADVEIVLLIIFLNFSLLLLYAF